MAFEPAEARTPIAIKDLSVILTDYVAEGEEPARKEGRYEVQVQYSTGEIVTRSGDLLPHITQAQKNALVAFLDALRVQAEEQILP